jgi:DNA-binding CsgD family transcriptional regulator
MNTPLNGVLEDIGAVIGYTATTALVGWFGGHKLWVPMKFEASHPLCKILGEKPTARLVEAYGGECLSIPLAHPYSVRDRRIVEFVLAGKSDVQIAGALKIGERRVKQLKDRLRKAGLLEDPAILAGKIAGKNSGQKPPGKTPLEMPGLIVKMEGGYAVDMQPATPMRTTGLLAKQVAALLGPKRGKS